MDLTDKFSLQGLGKSGFHQKVKSAQLDDKPCHQAGRVLRKSADKTNRGDNCNTTPQKYIFVGTPEYCEPRFVLNEKTNKM